MGLTIYGALRSRVTRPLWMAKELGLAYTLVPVVQTYRPSAAGAALTTQSPAFLAVNPTGQIPSIDDDGFVLHESLAIAMYLARKHGGPLAPRDVKEEGLAMQWSLWAATGVETKALQILQNPAGSEVREAAIAGLKAPLAVLDKALVAGGGFVIGGRFTVADINVAEVVRYAQAAPELVGAYPAVVAWLAVCQARPAFVEMMAERDKEPA